MPFKSPRFAGNAVLEEILADPDTGTKKLAKHSPEDAVRLAQKALIDLHWVEPYRRADGTILVPPQFVDGDYGPWTTATVLAYKKRYGICYPPGDPNGTYDGYTGPRTLQRLDQHCHLLDEASAAISARVAELLATGAVQSIEIHADGLGLTVKPIRSSPGAYTSAVIDGEVGAIIYKHGLGAFAVYGDLYVEWVSRELQTGTGDATDTLGFPISDLLRGAGQEVLQVELGALTRDTATGAVTVTMTPGATVLRYEE